MDADISPGQKNENAVDYSDIMEMADAEEEERRIREAMATMATTQPDIPGGEEDYDMDQPATSQAGSSCLMPPPSWVPGQPPPQQTAISSYQPPQPEKETAPLAAMLPEELKDKDV